MNGLNKVIIYGTLGADPELRASRDGKSYASLSLATNRYWRGKDGNTERRTDWHRVTLWGKKAELAQNHLRKGSSVCVEGFLSSYETEDEGKKRTVTAVTAENISFMSKGQPVENLSA